MRLLSLSKTTVAGLVGPQRGGPCAPRASLWGILPPLVLNSNLSTVPFPETSVQVASLGKPSTHGLLSPFAT